MNRSWNGCVASLIAIATISPLTLAMAAQIGSYVGRLLSVGVVLVGAQSASAHHSRAMFDMARNITYQGVVKEYQWQDPHSHIVIVVGNDAKDRSTIGTWVVEASAVSIMTSRGFTKGMFKPGDPITVVAHPNRNEVTGTVLLFYVIRPDGKRLYRAAHRYDMEREEP
jgi:hypothetical protein